MANTLQFTVESLEALQKKLRNDPDGPERREVTDARDAKLKARISRSAISLITWRYERGLATLITLGVLGEDGFSIADARRKLAPAHGRPLDVVKSKRTFRDVALEFNQDRLSKTKRGAEAWAPYEKHVLPRLGHVPVKDITPRLVRSVISEISTPTLDEEISRFIGGPGAARAAFRAIKAVLARALANQEVEFNAASSLSLRDLGISGRHRVRWVDEQLAPLFFDSLGLWKVLARKPLPEGSVSAQVRLGLAFLLYVPGPVRQSHRCAPQRVRPPHQGRPAADVDRPAGRIKGGTVDQVLPLPPTAVEIVQELVRLAEKAGSEYLLPSPADPKQSLADKTLTQTFRRMERSARIGPAATDGAERLTLHSLRASWRSWALELGQPADICEMVMGHRGGLQRLGYSGAAQLYTRSRALQAQAQVLGAVSAKLDTFWKGPGGKVVRMPRRATSKPPPSRESAPVT